MKKVFLTILFILSYWVLNAQSDSRNSYKQTNKDTIRVFMVFCEALNDPLYGYTSTNWQPDSMPANVDNYFDHEFTAEENIEGWLTKYFYQASFGKFVVLGDYYPELVQIEYDSIESTGYKQIIDYLDSLRGLDIITENDYSLNSYDFDGVTVPPGQGVPKTMASDNYIDMGMFFWRVNSKKYKPGIAGGSCSGQLTRPIKGMAGLNSFTIGGNSNSNITFLFRHEYGHNLLGSNNFHTSANNGGKRKILSCPSGYSLLSGGCLTTMCSAWDRWRMGWKPDGISPDIWARNVTANNIVSTDLVYGESFPNNSNEFILKDFVTYGDAIRIKLPYLQTENPQAQNQWIWLENHQSMEGNIDMGPNVTKGIYAYIQIGKNTRVGTSSDVFGEESQYIWPLCGFGNYDFDYEISETDFILPDSMCYGEDFSAPKASGILIADSDRQNPFTGQGFSSTLACNITDPDTISGVPYFNIITRNELFMANGVELDGQRLPASDFDFQEYPFFGSVYDAFTSGRKINMGTNPASAPIFTYETKYSYPYPVPRQWDNQKIYLNGLNIEILEQMPNGNIKVKIEWDHYNIENDVRWCGDIVLNEEFILNNGKTIDLEQGLSPTRPVNPVNFNGDTIYADNTILTGNDGSYMELDCNSELNINDNSKLHLKPGSTLKIKDEAELNINSGEFIVDECATIIIEGNGKINLFDGNGLLIDNNAILDFENGHANLWHDGTYSPQPGYRDPWQSTPPKYKITASETWSNKNYDSFRDIIVEEGATLNLLNTNINQNTKNKVKVYEGSKLIIDNSMISSWNGCSEGLWQGIEVHGNTTAYQDEIYQGTVELKNGAVIENAVTGIRAGALKTTLKNGGIVRASNATFKNCVNGIVFQPYRNYNPSNHYQTSKNKSSISRCNFQTTNHLANLGKNPQLFVMLHDVDMIYIKGNTFVNSNPGDYAITGRGKGIYANNASFTATYSCTSQQHPCPEENRLPNHFEGLTYGIMAENDAGYGNVEINENTFSNNLYGIRLHNLTNPVATLNNITVLPTYDGAMNAMGIFLQTCNQYQVEENYINCNSAETGTIGVNVVSTGFDPNEIYKNTFENLGYGVYAARTNIGLQLLCNEFNNNHQQVYIEEEGSIASHQGNPEEADAGNIFTPDCIESYNEIYNLGPGCFYYHLNEELKEPLCVNSEVALRLIELENTCPSNLGGGGSGQVTDLMEIEQKDTEEQQAKADLQSVIDGGNTQQLNTTVQSSPPSAALQLRNQLLGESPYLSETVMSTTAISEQSLPPVMVRDVLVANPLAGRSGTVDSALDSRQNPLPWYLLAQIKAAGQNMSARDLMEAHISLLGKEKEDMIKNNIKAYLTDTNGVKADSIVYLYSNYPTLGKAYSLVHFHLQDGNTTQARNAYQGISSQFQLSSTQQDEYNRMGTLLTLAETIYANDSTWHSIDSSQLSVISNIATDISDRAGLWARSILAIHGQAEYDFPVIIADSSKGSNTNPKPVVHSYSFHVYPDPANDYFAVEYCIEDREYKEARIQITAIDGKNMESKSLDNPADQLLFKTGAYKPGIYFCKLRLDNKTAGVRRFTITKGEEGEAILSTIDGTAIETPAMMVYPNPSNGNFTVEYTTGSKQCNNCKLQIVNPGGKIMKAIAIDKPAGRKQIHAGDMEKGIYYLVFYQNNNPVFREKIIVQ